MNTLLQDLRFALRGFRRCPGPTALVVLMLALGIGASTAIFSIVNGVLLKPLPYPDAASLVYVGTTRGGTAPSTTSIPDFIDYRSRIETIGSLAASQRTGFVLAADGGAVRIDAARVSPDFFTTLGVQPHIGRFFTPDEHTTSGEVLVVLSHGVWQTRWGGDSNVVGRSFRGEMARGGSGAFRVVGVLPSGFAGPAALGLSEVEVWLALPIDGAAYEGSRTSRSLQIVGRLKPGVGLEAARRELDGLAEAMAAEYPQAYRTRDSTLGIGVASLLGVTVGDSAGELLLLLGASGLLLLIACANIANLLLARATDRDKEVALRAALGAGRRRIVQQMLTESIVLALLGGLAGILVAHAATDAFRAFVPSDYPRLAEVAVEPLALAFAVGLALLTGALFGLAPAILASMQDLSRSLKTGGGRVMSRGGRARLRNVLVGAETALAIIVLAGAGLLVNSYLRLQSVDVGIDPDKLFLMQVGLGRSHTSEAQRAAFFEELTERVAALPGVASTSSVVDPPIGYVMWAPPVYTEGFEGDEAPWVPAHMVGPDYFRTMGMRVFRGRDFTARDITGSAMVAVVNESMAREFWSGEDPIGQRLRISPGPDAPWLTVVGLVNDVRQSGLAAPRTPAFYLPYAQHAWFGWNHIVARADMELSAISGLLKQALWEVDPGVPFDGVFGMAERFSNSLQAPRFRTLLLVGFAIVSLLLAAGGMYATMLYAVGQRTREIGVRMALGGDSSSVVVLVVRQGMKVAALGIAVGVAAAFAASRLLESFVFGVSPGDPVTLIVTAAIVTGAGFIACYLPARRATRVDPMVALSAE